MITSFLNDIQAWYEQPAGIWVLEQERQLLDKLWPQCPGDYLLQLGLTPKVADLTQHSRARQRFTLTPNRLADTDVVGNFAELPIATESVDVVLVHHWLGLLDISQPALEEVHRVLAPQGKIIVCGLVSARYWKFYDQLHHQTQFPHSLHSASAGQAKKWVIDSGFAEDLLMYHSYGLSLQLHNNLITSKLATLLKPLRCLSRMGVEGGGYILIAQKNKVAMTPVKVQWEKATDIPDAGVISSASSSNSNSVILDEQDPQQG